jgi:ABC-2 type transport system ATP-binding protein
VVSPAIEVDDLVKRYGARTVVDQVSLAVRPGQLVALLGRNGAGKTTTVECAEGFRRPDAGRIRVLGADPTAQRHRIADRVGVMLQDGGAYPAASPREMIGLYRKLFSRPRDEDDLLETTGLGRVADARFRTLSGGEKQRVNLALALVGSPEVLFVDEPTAGMDTAARHDTWTLLSRLRDEGAAVLLTTHYLEEAERLADEVVIVHEGRVAAAGPLAALTGSREQVLITTSAPADVQRLGQVLGRPVSAAGAGRFIVAADAGAIPAMAAALAAEGIPVTGVTTQRRTLEEVFLSLTGDGA